VTPYGEQYARALVAGARLRDEDGLAEGEVGVGEASGVAARIEAEQLACAVRLDARAPRQLVSLAAPLAVVDGGELEAILDSGSG